jgi:iron complex outermembrane recepter protein
MRRFIWLLGTAIGLVSVPALAQVSTGEQAADTSGDIVVTATRRATSIQDVPIAITAFSGEDLAERGVRELRDVADQISGVQIFRFVNGQPTWVIRGVGLVETNPNNPPPASIYADDVYQATTAQGQLALFDIGQIEVLKGPQGGLYGRNTSSGVIRVQSRLPSLERMEVNASGSYGTFDRVQLNAGISVPIISDRLAVRLAGTMTQGGGWQFSLSDRRDWGDADSWALRGAVVARPSETSEIRLIVNGARDRSELPLLRAVGSRASVAEGGVPPTFWCPALNAGRQDDACRTFPGVLSSLGLPYPANRTSDQSTDARRVLSNAINRLDIDNFSAVLNASFEIAGLKLTSITGYSDFGYGRTYDTDATSGEFGHQQQQSDFKLFSQELRLQDDEGRLRWSLGAVYNRETLNENRLFLTRDDPFAVSFYGTIGVQARSQAIANLRYDQRSESWAVVGEGEYDITDNLQLSAAVRYTDLDKSYRNGGFNAPLATGPVVPVLQPVTNFTLSNSYKLSTNWSGNVALRWRVTPDFTAYVTAGRGVKEGGFAGGFPFQAADAIVPFDEEVATSVEAGVRGNVADNALSFSAAVFYYNYDGAQTNVPVLSPLTGSVFGRPGNVDARNVGIEGDVTLRPVRGLSLNGSITLLDAKYTEDVRFPTQDGFLATYDGLRRQFAPEVSWTLRAAYDQPLGTFGVLGLSVDANGRSSRIDPFVAPTGTRREVALFSLGGYTLLNGRVALTAPGGEWSVALIGRNLANRTYVVSPATDGVASFARLFGEPRTFTAEVSVKF